MYCLVFRADVLVSFSDQHGLGLALEVDVGLAAGPRRPCGSAWYKDSTPVAMAQRKLSRNRISHGISLLVRCSPRLLILPPACQGILTLQWVTFGDLAVDGDSGK